jgi:uncharacterized membrane protein
MKNLIAVCLTLMFLTLTSCEVIGDIFSAGVYTGVIAVVLVIVVVIFIIVKLGKRG